MKNYRSSNLMNVILLASCVQGFSPGAETFLRHKCFRNTVVPRFDPLSFSQPMILNTASTQQPGYTSDDLSKGITEEDLDLRWQDTLKSEAVQRVRQALVKKYLQLGRSSEYAEREVDEFLSDRKRSQKFVEMRAFAVTSGESFTWEDGLQLAIAFLFGALFHIVSTSNGEV